MELHQVLAALEALAPLALSESWDNTGLLWGRRETNVTRVLTCLTLTPDVAAEVIETKAQLVVTHHPILFKPVQRLTDADGQGRMLLTLAAHGVSIYSPHTAWDNAPRGINQQLAERLGLVDIAPLRPQPCSAGYKVVTFVPATAVEAVRQALWSAGCGTIGQYDCCSFQSAGSGTFLGDLGTNPTIGTAGLLETVDEWRLEVVCPKSRLTAALAALRAAHPYEEPAIDVYPLADQPGTAGAGRRGTLTMPCSLREFAARVRQQLSAHGLQYVGDPQRPISRVGIACGSAGEFWTDAQRGGCDVLLTGETRFHTALEVREHHFALITAGHDATERFAMPQLAELLSQRCPGIVAFASQIEADPLRSDL
jgi:dinuclear metal center YbgI/SA1388 family protein